MKRDPTQEEREKMTKAILAGDRVEATSIYISIAKCGLTEAQDFIRGLTEELKTADMEKSERRRQKGRS